MKRQNTKRVKQGSRTSSFKENKLDIPIVPNLSKLNSGHIPKKIATS